MGFRREPTFLLLGEEIDRYSWKGVWLFFATYFGAFLVAAIIGPLIYVWIQNLPPPTDPDSLLAYLQSKHLSRYMDRVRLIGVAISLIWLIRWCGLWGRFGFNWSRGGIPLLGKFLLLGVVTMGLVVATQALLLDVGLEGEFSIGRLLERTFSALVGGLLLGWMEEAIFRGMLFRMFYTATKPLPAIILSSLVFAAVHFKHVPAELGEPVTWYSGFIVAAYQSVAVFFEVRWLEYINLVLVGMVLILVFMRTRNLVACMGLHAGWVLVRNVWSKLFEIPDGGSARFWGTDRIVDGYACTIMLAILVVVLYVNLQAHQSKGQVSLGGLA